MATLAEVGLGGSKPEMSGFHLAMATQRGADGCRFSNFSECLNANKTAIVIFNGGVAKFVLAWLTKILVI